MKSIHEVNNINDFGGSSEIFTEEVLAFISKEGFELLERNCYNEEVEGEKLYRLYIGGTGYDMFVYIGTNGIAVDRDYDCGGNVGNVFFAFKDSYDAETVFEEAYKKVIDYINQYR